MLTRMLSFGKMDVVAGTVLLGSAGHRLFLEDLDLLQVSEYQQRLT